MGNPKSLVRENSLHDYHDLSNPLTGPRARSELNNMQKITDPQLTGH